MGVGVGVRGEVDDSDLRRGRGVLVRREVYRGGRGVVVAEGHPDRPAGLAPQHRLPAAHRRPLEREKKTTDIITNWELRQLP